MKTLDELKAEALEACNFREHVMGKWEDSFNTVNGDISYCQCKLCAEWVQVETNPQPNSIDIGGPAVAVNCKGYIS